MFLYIYISDHVDPPRLSCCHCRSGSSCRTSGAAAVEATRPRRGKSWEKLSWKRHGENAKDFFEHGTWYRCTYRYIYIYTYYIYIYVYMWIYKYIYIYKWYIRIFHHFLGVHLPKGDEFWWSEARLATFREAAIVLHSLPLSPFFMH